MTIDADTVQLVGYAAALLTTSSFVPQALLTLRTRDVSGISAAMYGAFTAGVALWLLYGLLIRDWPIILANGTALGLASTILTIKLRVDRSVRAADQNEK
jgi:MtN3 and saliva related transmembrane protein